MLEEPGAERVTTAALAAKLEVSRGRALPPLREQGADVRGPDRVHRAERLHARQPDRRARDRRAARRCSKVLAVLLQFGEKNPGMTRVMVGDALVFENDRLIARMNQFFERIESQLRQSLRQPPRPPARRRRPSTRNAQASVLTRSRSAACSASPARASSAARPSTSTSRCACSRPDSAAEASARDDDDPGRRPAAHAARREGRASSPRSRTLLVADAHIGKAVSFRAPRRAGAARHDRARRWRRCRR